MYKVMILGFLSSLFACKSGDVVVDTSKLDYSKNSIHQFKVEALDGSEFDFSSLKGKKILVVNTASKCGLTPQYQKLQQLYEKYQNKGFEIIGFPANDFLRQEPGTDEEIAQFCSINYGVTFQMMSKIKVTGKDKHQIYKFLTQKALNGSFDSSVAWNFQKYLLDENGFLIKKIAPRKSPLDSEIISWLEE